MASANQYEASTPRSALRCTMWTALILLCVIAVAAVLRRMFALAHPATSGPADMVALDAVFAGKPLLTLMHIVPGLVLVVLVPFQFSRSFRNRHLRVHRWIGRIVVALGLVIGISAVPMSRHPVGGVREVTAIAFFDTFFLVALTNAFVQARRRQIAMHREWMIRAMAIALGIATVRPIMGVFFATARLTRMTPHDFFGIAFWIGFSLTYLAGEWWIRYTRASRPAGQRCELATAPQGE